ncbi:MAG: transglutaminase protein [Flaviaesturariibacter sp.]|nr:transglutaminase protein [Flaviaesturariibacter sp.]
MRLLLAVLCVTALSVPAFAQNQTADYEGQVQVGAIKKLNKKAKFGAYLVEKSFTFGTGKGIDKQPIVTAMEKGNVEMVSVEDKTPVGYLLPYNQFVQLKDYDFGIFYKNGFRSQKYPPERVSLTDDAIYMDDSYGDVYGFMASESGQRARFQYEYVYTDAKYLTRLFFSEPFPVTKKVISFKVPSWVELEIQEMNFTGNTIKKDVKKEKDGTVYTYTATNLNMLTNEPADLGKPYYLPHLVITVRGYTIDQKKYNGLRSIDDMYAWYNLLYKKNTNDASVLKAPVQQIIAGKSTDEEKIRAIYYWVQDNIRYIAFEDGYAGFVPQSVQDVFKNKYGDCKGMANLVTEMLKSAGYDAHFAWIGTRDIPYDRTKVQSLCVDNHAISVLYFKGKTYFIDGTEKYAALGKNAYRIQGKNVLVQNGDTYKTEVVPPAVVADSHIDTKANLALKGDRIGGHVTLSFDGEAKNYFHNLYNSIPTNKRKDFINSLLQLNNKNAEVANVKTSDFKNRDIPILLEADIDISNHVTAVDKLLYTSIDFFPQSMSTYVPDDKRQNPIDFDNVFVTNDVVTLELPAAAKPESLPAPFTAAFKETRIDATYAANGNRIVLNKKTQFGSPIIYNADFATYKTFINSVKEFNNTNIVIKLP